MRLLSDFLLCVPYKILKRLIYTCINPIIDPSLPQKQAEFCCGKSTVDQASLLTKHIEDNFMAKQKAGAVFVDLTMAYNAVWNHGHTCKLLQLLSDKHVVCMIMKLVITNFTLTTSNNKQSRF